MLETDYKYCKRIPCGTVILNGNFDEIDNCEKNMEGK